MNEGEFVGRSELDMKSDDGQVCVPCPLMSNSKHLYFTPTGELPMCLMEKAANECIENDERFSEMRRNRGMSEEAMTAERDDKITSTLYRKVLASTLTNHK